jgi:hypothetical protein
MKKDEASQPRHRVPLLFAAVLSFALVIYPLSAGPASFLVSRGYMSHQVWDVVYAPVVAVSIQLGIYELFAVYLAMWY